MGEVWAPFLPGYNNRNQINPWIQPTDNRAHRDTAHHSRNFIESQHTTRDEGTMTDQEPESTAQERDVQNVTHDDVTPEEEAEFNERGNNKEN